MILVTANTRKSTGSNTFVSVKPLYNLPLALLPQVLTADIRSGLTTDLFERQPPSQTLKNQKKRISKNTTPLFGASSHYRHRGIVNVLRQYPGINVNQPDQAGKTPLIWAALYGHTNTVNALRQYPRIDVNQSDNAGLTPLIWAILQGHTNTVIALLQDSDINVNQPALSGETDETPLLLAALHGHTNTVNALLQHPDINVNQSDKAGWTPLIWATKLQYGTTIEALNAHGATE